MRVGKTRSVWHTSRRALLVAAATALATVLLPFDARASEAWPNHPVKLIVPYAPGGGSDLIARAIATKLAGRIGQPIIVENRSGAGGILGVADVAKAPPDGYTLLFTTTAFATNASTGIHLPYDSAKDFQPIGKIGGTPLLVVVPKDSRIKTLGELVDLARAKPNTVTYGSSGVGSMSHLGMELLASEAKVQFLHVPYKGMAPVFTDLVGGNVQASLCTFASASNLIHAGKLRGLAVASAQRSPFAPNLPSATEAGFPEFHIDFWWGLLAPAGVPPAVVKRLNDELNATLSQPDTRELLAREAAIPTPGTAEDFGKLISFELVRWSKLVKEANIKVD
jgi:tripartite-type tricarboxylate transporter receptor subunit TctC